MATFPLEQPILDAFLSATASPTPPDVRLLVVQTAPSGKSLALSGSFLISGSDKEDFQPLLTKAFAEDINRSGYALYRLDSQAANGDWEWLCIAYQPEGAKVKEKMQYVKTRTALLSGLNEQHFIETIYATSPADFRFPTKLRNARKHDYQNPQLKTAGKPASEAAGTDAGGAKRNFGQFQAKQAASTATAKAYQEAISSSTPLTPTPTPPRKQHSELASPPTTSEPVVSEDKGSTSSTIQEEQSAESVDEVSSHVESQPNKKEEKTLEDVSLAATSIGAPLERIAEVTPTLDATGDAGSVSLGGATEEQDVGSIAPSAQVELPPTEASSEQLEETRAEASKELAPAVREPSFASQGRDDVTDVGVSHLEEEMHAESKAPEEPPTRAELPSSAHQELSHPLVPSAELAKEQLQDPDAIISRPRSQSELKSLAHEQEASTTGIALEEASTQAAASSSSQSGSGDSQGLPNGGHDSSSKGKGPPSNFTSPKSYEWQVEAEAALSGLASRRSGSSEHNFVSIVVSPSSSSEPHQVDLSSPPRFLPPGDLKEALKIEVSDADGITIAFYRYPLEVEDKKVVFMYVEPPRGNSSSLKNSYLNCLEPIRLKAAQLSGLEVERDNVDTSYGPYPRPTPEQAEEVSSRIESVKYRIEEATRAIGRTKPPRLVAVSKLHPPSSILAAYVHAKQLHFGENYVQELVDKAKVLPRDIRWHFVGGLQSNKGKLLASVPNLYLLETLDSIKAANVLEKALASPDAVEREEPLRVFLQVNTSGEEAKSGLPPLREDASSEEEEPLLELAKHVMTDCPHLLLSGLMTIGSAANSSKDVSPTNREEALSANPDFAKLYQSRKLLVERVRSLNLENPIYSNLLGWGSGGEADGKDDEEEGKEGGLELSMGMTNDFPIAIAAGSDNVRIGTDCFGPRPGTREEARKAMEGEISMDVSHSVSSHPPLVGDKGFAKPKRPGGRK